VDTPNKLYVLDCETNGLAYDCDRIHILSYTEDGHTLVHLSDYDDMREFLSQEDALFVGHNVIMFDMVVFNRILGVPMDYRKWIDTLALSWFLEPDRKSHGLGSFQEESGLEKPQVDDWGNVTFEQMKHRCGSDVLLNWWLWQKQLKRLQEIYH